MTDWVKKNLKKSVLHTKFCTATFRSKDLPRDIKIEFTDFKVNSGEGSRSVVRNKARFLFDMNCTIDVTVTIRQNDDEQTLKGKIECGEVSDSGIHDISFKDFKDRVLCDEMREHVSTKLTDALNDFMILFQQQ